MAVETNHAAAPADGVRTSEAVGAPATIIADRVQRRVLRRVEPWSVLRISFLFYASLLVVALVASVLVWAAASAAGVVENLESVIEELFGLRVFEFEPLLILQSIAVGGAVLVLIGTGANVVLAVLYNLIAEVLGGIEVWLVDDRPANPRRTKV